MPDVLELIAVAAFALSGAAAALERRLDVVVCCLAAVAAGLAAPTLRDVLLSGAPGWVDRPLAPALCLIAAGVAWALGRRALEGEALAWVEAVAVSAAVASSTAGAGAIGAGPLAACLIGVAAAAAGGAVRDGVLRGSPLLALSRPLYVAAAAAAAVLFVLLRLEGVRPRPAEGAAFLLALGLQAGAIRLGWALPPRDEGE